MKFTTNTNELKNATAITCNYMLKNNHEFAGKISIVGNDGILEMRATDYDEAVVLGNIKYTSSDLIEKSFDELTVDGKSFLQSVRAGMSEDTTLEISEGQILVKSGKSRYKVETTSINQDFKLPENGKNLSLDGNLLEGLNSATHAIDGDNVKVEIQGALVSCKQNKISIVGTNARVLSVYQAKSDADDFEIIIPKKAIVSIGNLFAGQDITAFYSETELTIKSTNITYNTKLLNGTFPNWERILPTGYKHIIKFNKKALTELFKQVTVFDVGQVKFEISGGKITLTATDEKAMVEDEIAGCDYELLFHMNAKFVLDHLSSFDGESLSIGYNDDNLPVTFIANDSYKEIMMPIVIDKEQNIEKAA